MLRKTTYGILTAALLLTSTAACAWGTTVHTAGKSFKLTTGYFEAEQLRIKFLYKEESGAIVPYVSLACQAEFDGVIPTAPDNPNYVFGKNGSVITDITPKIGSCGEIPEVKAFAPTEWTLSWDPGMATIAIPENGMQIVLENCIVDLNTTTSAPTSFAAQLSGTGTMLFSPQQIPAVFTGTECSELELNTVPYVTLEAWLIPSPAIEVTTP